MLGYIQQTYIKLQHQMLGYIQQLCCSAQTYIKVLDIKLGYMLQQYAVPKLTSKSSTKCLDPCCNNSLRLPREQYSMRM